MRKDSGNKSELKGEWWGHSVVKERREAEREEEGREADKWRGHGEDIGKRRRVEQGRWER